MLHKVCAGCASAMCAHSMMLTLHVAGSMRVVPAGISQRWNSRWHAASPSAPPCASAACRCVQGRARRLHAGQPRLLSLASVAPHGFATMLPGLTRVCAPCIALRGLLQVGQVVNVHPSLERVDVLCEVRERLPPPPRPQFSYLSSLPGSPASVCYPALLAALATLVSSVVSALRVARAGERRAHRHPPQQHRRGQPEWSDRGAAGGCDTAGGARMHPCTHACWPGRAGPGRSPPPDPRINLTCMHQPHMHALRYGATVAHSTLPQ